GLDQMPRDREAEPCAAGLAVAGGVAAEQGLEEARQAPSRNRVAAVPHGESDAAVAACPVQRDVATCRRVPNCVVEEVRDDATQELLVGERRDLRAVCCDRDVLLRGARAEANGRLPKEIPEVDP